MAVREITYVKHYSDGGTETRVTRPKPNGIRVVIDVEYGETKFPFQALVDRFQRENDAVLYELPS